MVHGLVHRPKLEHGLHGWAQPPGGIAGELLPNVASPFQLVRNFQNAGELCPCEAEALVVSSMQLGYECIQVCWLVVQQAPGQLSKVRDIGLLANVFLDLLPAGGVDTPSAGHVYPTTVFGTLSRLQMDSSTRGIHHQTLQGFCFACCEECPWLSGPYPNINRLPNPVDGIAT